ncbi:hypothetical protein B0675_26570 [Streptomyces sp. M41(2017)]|uniref:DUF2637 domain-containing protein n=1 Tax=Streptomyces sp. M41(2017) TaxID=1955065 RepID=UPI0009EFB228|nr:DUF2637 domain-containing protein [Streptomyces sp. M41(2017)]OQQ13801.1 hypothetical protein B0675_26570 [Streptomyces sp. M41(2017)]
MVSVFGAVVSYDPLRHVATPTVADDLAHCWPLLVFGPWLVASLSVLRAALHRRRAAHSWVVVVLFSAFAVALCVNQADKTLTGMAVVGLPPRYCPDVLSPTRPSDHPDPPSPKSPPPQDSSCAPLNVAAPTCTDSSAGCLSCPRVSPPVLLVGRRAPARASVAEDRARHCTHTRRVTAPLGMSRLPCSRSRTHPLPRSPARVAAPTGRQPAVATPSRSSIPRRGPMRRLSVTRAPPILTAPGLRPWTGQ